MPIYKNASRVIAFQSLTTAGAANTATTPACVVSKDGAAQASTTNSPTHLGGGHWTITMTASEMNADLVVLVATGASLVPAQVTIYPEADYTSARAALLANLDAAISTRSTYAGGDTSGTTTLLSRLTNIRAGLLDNLDAAISTRSTYAGGDTSGTTTLLARLTNIRAGLLDNLDVAVSTRLATSGYTAPPTDYQQRAVAVTLPASPPAGYADSTTLGTVQTLVSAINTAIVTSQTTGAVVDNTGTTLAFTVSGMSQSKSYIGMQVAFTSGANSASRQIITGQANSASNLRLSVTTPFGAAPSSGDTVSVF